MESTLPYSRNPDLMIDSPIGALSLYFYGAGARYVMIWRREEFTWQGFLFKRLSVDMVLAHKGYWRPFLSIARRKSINGRWAKVTSSLRQKGSLSNMIGDFVGHYCDNIEVLECRIKVLEAQQRSLLGSLHQDNDIYWRLAGQDKRDHIEKQLVEAKVEIVELEEMLSERRAEESSTGSLIRLVNQQ